MKTTSTKWITVRAAFAIAALVLASGVRGQDAVIHLKNGGKVTARIVDYQATYLKFRSQVSDFASEMRYDQIDYVELTPPDAFTRAVQFFEFGRYEEAIPLFEQIAAIESRATGYPAPGNFATLAHRRLLDCYRRLGNGDEVARHLGHLDLEKLPPAEREISPVFRAWAAAGSEDWAKVLEVAEAAESGKSAISGASEDGIDMAYLKGLALKETGEPREAVVAFASAYTLNAATDSRISRLALMEAARLVEQDEERLAEFQAQVHFYASVFGSGKLWADAGDQARGILGTDVEIGEAALGQTGRSVIDGDFMEETFGLRAIEQVTADHMKKVGLRRKAAGARKKK